MRQWLTQWHDGAPTQEMMHNPHSGPLNQCHFIQTSAFHFSVRWTIRRDYVISAPSKTGFIQRNVTRTSTYVKIDRFNLDWSPYFIFKLKKILLLLHRTRFTLFTYKFGHLHLKILNLICFYQQNRKSALKWSVIPSDYFSYMRYF